ncbi:hypothetical protein ABGB12_30390 [Actinocorallia sp. B10E7]|uniref:hypothetical protein n=1 Tax=Actinocorallia sp. B10E7 TaxID=3153558 RepID=UPI00325C9A60
MNDPPTTLPDVEVLVVDFLQDDPALTGVTVTNVVPPGFDGTTPAVLVSRMGGVWIDDQRLDTPIVQLECYGADKQAANTIAIAARVRMLHMIGLALPVSGTATAVIADCVETDGPRWLPDYLHSAADRYVSFHKLTIRPL